MLLSVHRDAGGGPKTTPQGARCPGSAQPFSAVGPLECLPVRPDEGTRAREAGTGCPLRSQPSGYDPPHLLPNFTQHLSEAGTQIDFIGEKMGTQ